MPSTHHNRPQPARQATVGLIAATGLTALGGALTGCGVSSWFASDEQATPAVTPESFVQVPEQQGSAPPQASAGNSDATDTPTGGSDPDTHTSLDGATDDTTPVVARRTDRPAPPGHSADTALTVNAMVGFINSEAVYADQVFDVNLVAQLQSFGRRFDGEQFRNAASQAIQEKLRGIIINKLILGEAELNLEDRQRQYIDSLVNRERDELIRFYGQGSVSKARAEFRRDRGLELDEHLTKLREDYAVQAYLQQKVIPKISISQINVQNYYEDNKAKYHQPDLRSFRVIRVKDPKVAQAVTDRLKRGESFKAVASDPAVNLYNPDGSGLFNSGDPVPGDRVYGIEPVNEALLKLKEGQHTGPIPAGDHHYFTQLVTFKPGKEVSLSDAQLEIEQVLRNLEYERLVLRMRMGMLESGSYTDPEKMGAKLLEIAAARYDR